MINTSSDKSFNMRQMQKKAAYGLFFGVVVFIGISLWADVTEMKNIFQEFNWAYIPLILLLVSLGYVGRFLKWQFYMRELEIDIPRQVSARIFFSGLALAVTPGKVGEVLKSYLLWRKYKISFFKTAPTVIAERLTDLIAMLLLSSLGFSLFPNANAIMMSGLTLTAFVLMILQWRNLGNKLIAICRYVPVLKSRMKYLDEIYDSAYTLTHGRLLVQTVLVSILAWLMECLALYYIFQGFGCEQPLATAVLIFSLSSIAGGVSMLPGGLGVAEGSMLGLVLWIGLDKSTATAITLMARFGTLWFGVIVGLLALRMSWSFFELRQLEGDEKIE